MVAVASVAPRVRSVPEFSESLGREAVELARSAGLELDDWQADILEAALSVREDGKWAAFEVGVAVPRQNGKGGVLEARELAGLFLIGEKLIIHSAHEFDTSLEAFYRLEALVQDTPELHAKVKPRGGYSHSHGTEGITLKDGRRVRFKTRTKGGRRGFSCDCLILDEAMFIPEFSHSALLPTLSARPNPQVWYTGSAVDQDVHEDGFVFTRVRERGHTSGPSLAYFEWSLDADSPADLADEIMADPESWAQANPALGIRISEEHVAHELESMDARGFAVERLGVGDWPSTDGLGVTPVSYSEWVELKDQKSVLLDPVCLAFDVSPERKSAIVAAGRRADGLLHVEVLEHRTGTRWLAGRLADLVDEHQPFTVCCDGYGPAASVLVQVVEAGVLVKTVTASEHAQACGQLVDLVSDKQIRHLGSFELANAIRSAKTRPLGDAWAWSRKASSVDICPLVAATLALSAAAQLPDDASEVAIW